MIILASFLSGICFASFFAAGIFFLKFWKASRDSFFLIFAIACWLLAIERAVVVIFSYHLNLVTPENETGSWVYFIRLIAFASISLAVWKKNRNTTKNLNEK